MRGPAGASGRGDAAGVCGADAAAAAAGASAAGATGAAGSDGAAIGCGRGGASAAGSAAGAAGATGLGSAGAATGSAAAGVSTVGSGATFAAGAGGLAGSDAAAGAWRDGGAGRVAGLDGSEVAIVERVADVANTEPPWSSSGAALVAAAAREGLGFTTSSGCTSRVRPSRSARRRTRSACASMMPEEWLLTPMPRASQRSKTSLFVIPSSRANSNTRIFFAAKVYVVLYFDCPNSAARFTSLARIRVGNEPWRLLLG